MFSLFASHHARTVPGKTIALPFARRKSTLPEAAAEPVKASSRTTHRRARTLRS
jgi:hypothetical protein